MMGEFLSVNSLSGGRSSTYMALHYPADIYIYACVLTDDRATRIDNHQLRNYCQAKLPNHDWERSGNREDYRNLVNLMKLEQMLGKEIAWVSAEFTFDRMIEYHRHLPNSRSRFCTVELKIEPIYRYLYAHHAKLDLRSTDIRLVKDKTGKLMASNTWQADLTTIEPILMQIGFRAGEEHRVDRQCFPIDIPSACSLDGKKRTRWHHINNWKESIFPLIADGIDNKVISEWASNSPFKFPEITDCDFCFFRTQSELLRQAVKYPERAKWWLDWEEKTGATWSGRKTGKTSGTGCGCEM